MSYAIAYVYDAWIEGNWTTPPPTVSSWSGSATIGSTITVTGANFTGATAVKIGSNSVSSYTVVSASSITFTLTTAHQGWSGVLSVTTASGTGSGGSTLTVPTISVGAPTPGGQYTSVGYTRQFTSGGVSGAVNTSVTWSTNGGSITGSGLYTAPGTSGTYTIWNTSVADSSKSNSCTVYIVALPTASLSATRGTITAGQSTTITPIFT